MKTEKGCVIIMNDGEKIFLEFSKAEINQEISDAVSIGQKRIEVTVDGVDRDLYYNYIQSKYDKVRHIALPEPKKEFKELTPEERKARDKMIKEMLSKTYENRRKNFLEDRKEKLKQLAKDEKRFNLETTEDKLIKLEGYVKKELGHLKEGKQLES